MYSTIMGFVNAGLASAVFGAIVEWNEPMIALVIGLVVSERFSFKLASGVS